MTAIEALEQAREKIATFGDRAWETGNMTMAQGIGESLEILTAMISAERDRLPDTGETKPEPGDVVAWPNPPHGHMMIGLYGRDWTSDIGLVVLMRAAEVRSRIEGEK